MPGEFMAALAELRQGGALADADKALLELVGQIKATSKGGSISLTISIAPAKNKGNVLFVDDQVKVVTPKPDREQTIFFAGEDNRLSRRDPRQPVLPGVTVDVRTGELREFPRVADVKEASNGE